MELAATAFSAITSAMATAAPAAAGAASAAAGAGGWVTTMAVGGPTMAAGATSGLLSSLQGVATVGSQISQILGGGAGLLQGIQGSRMADINARAETLKSEAQAIAIQRDLVQKIGRNRVAFAGAGLDVSSGGDIEDSLRAQAAFDTSMARTTGEMGMYSQKMRGANAELGGWASLVEHAGKAVKGGADYALDISKRR